MGSERQVPEDPLSFIKSCVSGCRIQWTYHVNMRLKGRFIPRLEILEAVDTFELVEDYSDERYDPTYLVLGNRSSTPFHIVVVADVERDNVRIRTAYRPGLDEWLPDLMTRRSGR